MRILRELHFNNSTVVPRGQPGYDRAHKVRSVIENTLGKCLTVQATQGKLSRRVNLH